MGNIGIWQLLIVAIIVALLFGTKKIRNIGGDLGSAIRSFKKAVKEEPTEEDEVNQKPADKQILENRHSQDADFNKVDSKSNDKV